MLEKNVLNIKKSIENKCNQIGRNYLDVTLVAVSKQHPAEIINQVLNCGLIHFGENKAQELKWKSEVCAENIKWHFIGHLQTNKVKDIVPIAYLIHSVDSLKLAREINKRAKNLNKVQNILIELKTSDEETKFGITTDDDFTVLVNFCREAENINLLGLMTMAPFTNNENLIRTSFKKLHNNFTELNEKGFELKHLSMGMTNDYEIALEEGATILRIGTAIFGSRSYN